MDLTMKRVLRFRDRLGFDFGLWACFSLNLEINIIYFMQNINYKCTINTDVTVRDETET